ncbi:MAG: response regulator [Polyangiaceae bacterium]
MANASTSPSGTRARPGRVLVVDDEPLLGDALRRVLSSESEVVVVTEAADALGRLERGERYDVVLCDLMMPAMDGIELHRRLSVTLPREAERIVFVTGGAITSRVDAFFRGVANLLLEKPIDIDDLRALIERRVRGVPDDPRRAAGDSTA